MWSPHLHTWNDIMFVWIFILTDWPCCAIGIANQYRAEFICYTSQTVPFIYESYANGFCPHEVHLCQNNPGWSYCPCSVPVLTGFPAVFVSNFARLRIPKEYTIPALFWTRRAEAVSWTEPRPVHCSLTRDPWLRVSLPTFLSFQAMPYLMFGDVLRCAEDSVSPNWEIHLVDCCYATRSNRGFFQEQTVAGILTKFGWERHLKHTRSVSEMFFIFELGKTMNCGSPCPELFGIVFSKWGWILLHTLTGSSCPGPW